MLGVEARFEAPGSFQGWVTPGLEAHESPFWLGRAPFEAPRSFQGWVTPGSEALRSFQGWVTPGPEALRSFGAAPPARNR